MGADTIPIWAPKPRTWNNPGSGLSFAGLVIGAIILGRIQAAVDGWGLGPRFYGPTLDCLPKKDGWAVNRRATGESTCYER